MMSSLNARNPNTDEDAENWLNIVNSFEFGKNLDTTGNHTFAQSVVPHCLVRMMRIIILFRRD